MIRSIFERTSHLHNYLTSSSVTGSLLFGSAIVGIVIASSPWSVSFQHLLDHIPFPSLPLTTETWISHGLMSFFFLLLALEIRQEFDTGSLKEWKQALIPLLGAAGGMAVPALTAIICDLIVPHSPGFQGWAIPTATDAAFTVPILTLIPGIPSSLRAFLMSLAVFDDLGAILILALFYGQTPHLIWVLGSLLPLSVLFLMGKKQVRSLWWYLLPTALLWLGLYHAGIEPTLAGVALGVCYPPRFGRKISHVLAFPVGTLILPLFALVSTGINLRQISPHDLTSAPFLSSALGLCLGKPIGVGGTVLLINQTKILPPIPFLKGMGLLGISFLCGIGFTISLLITQLAYPSPSLLMEGRCGVLIGSIISALLGAITLRCVFRRQSVE
ncbi:Na(+)/H(+) antiporter NhaA [Saccharibacter sp. 17.LH.SD]|uniref:Na+/H+ antiporter NhaA n=1 Tax=Saccharibacter sp. 17.LH.SD TaxID=2689393 RepID=UPI00137206AB|nr:Na+/H+ antiporter NhaA [Saccharibacter sp. 17.LH.SD]MXV45169.1 Na(+)/H(+) antiporter NhaA [Saccharibacter sp. 17.LH.SD]